MKKYWVIENFIDWEDGWELLVFETEKDIPKKCRERYGVYNPDYTLANNKKEAIKNYLKYETISNYSSKK